jgi:outer membrane protein insertion porin family
MSAARLRPESALGEACLTATRDALIATAPRRRLGMPRAVMPLGMALLVAATPAGAQAPPVPPGQAGGQAGVQPPAVPRPRTSPQHPPAAAGQPSAQPGGVIATIRIEGNRRIEDGTIRSYMLLQPGDPFDPDRIDRSLKTLYATGLFQDVSLTRQGDALVVRVAENPIVNRVAYEGNHKLTDDKLNEVVQLKPRSVFTPAQAQADRARILDAYAKDGRYTATVEPEIIRLSDNRVDVVFKIDEGQETLISRIAFVGNHAFGEGDLRDVINSRESAWWRFLTNSDQYDPQRIDYDKELLRRFYLKHGYADFAVSDATAELSPDRKSFFVTFVLHEGERYRVGKITIDSHLPKLSGDSLKPQVQLATGDWYDGDAMERTVQALSDTVHDRGYAFVQVTPNVARDAAKHIVDLNFSIAEGPRVYVERINISGNTRTEDKVIRREFRLAEGDAYDADAVRRSRQRLEDLGYFSTVRIDTAEGSAADRAVLNTTVDEKSTGQFTIGGGYSTDIGALANVGLGEKNLVGTGIDGSINTTIAQKESQIDLAVTDPYFLDRNLVAGFDLFRIQNDEQTTSQYSERRTGFTLNLGYQFNDHLSQAWNYSLVQRTVYDVATTASLYILNAAGTTLLSQIGTTFTLDYRDSKIDPHTGFAIRVGEDFAGAGGDVHYVRSRGDVRYYVPLDYFTGNSDWDIALSAGAGYLSNLGHGERIIDRFFLGGDNLRGFESGGAGPHDVNTGDSLGGRFIYTQSTELRFPLPVSPDIGVSGRAFVDVGGLSQASTQYGPITDSTSPRVGAGVGLSWKTPFGLINIDVADAVVKYAHDQTQVFRLGFGTRF